MGLKMKAGITWSTLELTGLLEDEDSRVFFERAKRHLGLHPFHLTDLNAALREILSSSLNKCDPELNGIILSYRNPRLLNSLGDILYDACYVHVDIEADFYVFRPEVACNLKGIVNKKSEDHVGILVHKAFNVSIPKPEDDDDWPGNKVSVGQEVKFTVSFFDFKGRLPYIRGVFDPDDYLQGCKIFDPRVNIVPDIETGRTRKKFQDIAAPQQNKRVVFNSDSEEDAHEQVSPKKKLKASKSKKNQTVDSEEETSDLDPPKKQTKKSKAIASELKSSDSKSKSKKSKKKSMPSCEVKEEEEETKASTKKLSKNLLSKITENETSDEEEDSRHVQLKKSIKKSKMSKHRMSDSESEVERKSLSKRQSKKSKTTNTEVEEMSDVDRKPIIFTPVTSQDSGTGGDEESSSRSRKKSLKKSKADETVKSSRTLKHERNQNSDTEGDDTQVLKSLSKKQSKKSKSEDSEIEIKSEVESEPNIFNSITNRDSDSEEKTSVRIPSPKKSLKMAKNTENNVSPKKQIKKSKNINKTSFAASDTEREEEAVQISSPKKPLKKSKNTNADTSVSSDTDTKHRIFKFLTCRESDTEKDEMPPPPVSSPKKQLKKTKVINRISPTESEAYKVPGPKSSPKKSLKKSKNTNSDTSGPSDIDNKFKNLKFITKPNRNEKLIETPQSKSTTGRSSKKSKTSLSPDNMSEREEIPDEEAFAKNVSSQSQSQVSSTEKYVKTNSKNVKTPRSKKVTSKIQEKRKATDSSISKNLSTSSKSAKTSKKSVTDTEELKQVDSTKEHKEKVDVLNGTKRKKKQSTSKDMDSVKKESQVKESLKELLKDKKIKTEDSDSAEKLSPVKKTKMSFFKNGNIINSTPYSFIQERKTLSKSKSQRNVVAHSDSDSETDENESLKCPKLDKKSKKSKSQNNEIDNYEKSLKQRIARSSCSLDDTDAEPNGTASSDNFLKSLSIKEEPIENDVQFKRQESTPPRNKSSRLLSTPGKVTKRKRKNTIADNDSTDNETSAKDEIFKGKRIKVEPTDSNDEKISARRVTPATYKSDEKDSSKRNRIPKQSSGSVFENSKSRKKKTNKPTDDDTDNEKDKVMNSVQKNRRILDSSEEEEEEDYSINGSGVSPKQKRAYRRNINRHNNQNSSMEEEKFYVKMKIKEEPL